MLPSQAFREVFEYLIEDFKTYKPLLSAIKHEYEMMLVHQREKIRELEPLKVFIKKLHVNSEMSVGVISLSSSLLNAVTVTLPCNPALPPSLVSLFLCSLSPSGLRSPSCPSFFWCPSQCCEAVINSLLGTSPNQFHLVFLLESFTTVKVISG